MEDLELLPGEVVNLRLERVGVFYGSTCGLDPQGGHGSLVVTNYQMSFNWGGKKPICVPHLNVTKLSKRDRATDKRSEDWDGGQGSAANPLTHKMGMLHLERRDATPMTIILFAASTLIDCINDELYPNPTRQCSKLFETLMSYVFPRSLTKVFAFSYRQQFEPETDGWKVYNPDDEFARQGVLAPNSGWRVSHVNHEYTACESYPRKVAVPAGIRDWEIKKALEFRANGRFPIMVWKSPRGESVICRSAQPLPGLFRMRNKEDERLVGLIRAANTSPAPLYIIDARPHTNAQANTVFRAAGYERGSYEKCEIVFLGIENIHAVRKSYTRLRELCTSPPADDDERWMQNVQETYWLQYISKLLQGSRRIAEFVMLERASVLIHCSDGWDRTPQISSLAQMMIDPFYRTLRGFEVVVEKEWCALGHKFSLRYAHGGSSDKQEAAPVIAQWADCIWQMMRQFPTAFEVNEELLLELIEMVHVCKFGTFLFNSECERRRAGVHKKTVSFWSHVNMNLDRYRNPHYVKYPGLIFPETSVRRLYVWEKLFFRDCTSLPPPQDHCPSIELESSASHISRQLTELNGSVEKLSKENAELRIQTDRDKMRIRELESRLRSLAGEAFSPHGSSHSAGLEMGQRQISAESLDSCYSPAGSRNGDLGNAREMWASPTGVLWSSETRGRSIFDLDESWHKAVRLRAEGMKIDGQIAELVCDVVDCVASQLGEALLPSANGEQRSSKAARSSESDSSEDQDEEGMYSSDSKPRVLARETSSDPFSENESTGGSAAETAMVEGEEGWMSKAAARGTNPLQDPFGLHPSENGNMEGGRRRRRGARVKDVPPGISLEAPLDETSAKWIPDQGVSQCFKCKRSFDFFNRRHHCRSCGRIFCSACSSQKSRISRMQIDKLVRVCLRCYTYLQRLESDLDP